MLLRHVEFGIYGICTFFPDLVISQYANPKQKNMNEDTIDIMRSNIETSIQIIYTVEMIMSNMIYKTNRKMQTCKDIANQTKMLSIRDFTGHPDNTVTNNDLVKLQ